MYINIIRYITNFSWIFVFWKLTCSFFPPSLSLFSSYISIEFVFIFIFRLTNCSAICGSFPEALSIFRRSVRVPYYRFSQLFLLFYIRSSCYFFLSKKKFWQFEGAVKLTIVWDNVYVCALKLAKRPPSSVRRWVADSFQKEWNVGERCALVEFVQIKLWTFWLANEKWLHWKCNEDFTNSKLRFGWVKTILAIDYIVWPKNFASFVFCGVCVLFLLFFFWFCVYMYWILSAHSNINNCNEQMCVFFLNFNSCHFLRYALTA